MIMNHLTRFFFYLVVFTMLLGCSSRLNQIYAYKPVKYQHSKGWIDIRLAGTYISQEKITKQGSPYDLLISFKSDSISNYFVTLQTVKLYNANSMELVFENQEAMVETAKINRYRTYSASYFDFKKLHLE